MRNPNQPPKLQSQFKIGGPPNMFAFPEAPSNNFKVTLKSFRNFCSKRQTTIPKDGQNTSISSSWNIHLGFKARVSQRQEAKGG